MTSLTHPDCAFNQDLVDRAFKFFQRLVLTKSTKSGHPERMRLLPVHKELVGTLLGWQRADGTRQYRHCYFTVARKNAKALALDTALPTPTGWTTMASVAVGDKLFDEQGKPCSVTAVSEVFHDHECYQVTFSNGEVIVADAGHQWLTEARQGAHGPTVRTTEELYSTQIFGSRGDRNHAIRPAAPLQITTADLPLDPYVLGVWLGNGSRYSTDITCGDHDVLEMKRLLSETGCLVSASKQRTGWRVVIRQDRGDGVPVTKASEQNIRKRLRRMDVLYNKHIPEVYLRASETQRLALLQGLMDTDGTINKNGRVLSFTTIIKKLADQVSELLSSLGVKHSIRENTMRCNGRDVPGTAYNLQFNTFSDVLQVFRLPRKLARMRKLADCSIAPRSRSIQITSIEKVPSVPVKCVAVDSPSRLFLCGRTMLPTHNTQIAASLALYLLLAEKAQPEVYIAAKDRDQASLCYTAAADMVRASKLEDYFNIVPYQKEIRCYHNGGKLKALSSEGASKHGLNPSVVIFDELHAWGEPEQELYDALTTGSVARQQPLRLIITTAGISEHSLCGREYAYACQVRDGVVQDSAYLPFIFELPRDADWTDEKLWHLANPTLGEIVSIQALREARDRALKTPSEQVKFRRLHCNQWVNSEAPWVSLETWDTCEWDGEEIVA